MVKVNVKENPLKCAFCKELFEKFGERRLFSRGEYFAHSGEVMKYAGWIVSGGFKYSLTSSDGNNRVIDFSLDDLILIDYESVMHSTKTRTDIIALEDSEVIVIPAKIIRERLNGDPELNMRLMMLLFEQLYDQFSDFIYEKSWKLCHVFAISSRLPTGGFDDEFYEGNNCFGQCFFSSYRQKPLKLIV